MTTDPKNKDKQSLIASKLSRSPFWFKSLVSFLYEFGTFRIGAVVAFLIIVIIMGDLFTKYGLILVLCMFGFLLLGSLKRWFDK